MGLGLGLGLGMVLGLGLGTGLALELRVDWVLSLLSVRCPLAQNPSKKKEKSNRLQFFAHGS